MRVVSSVAMTATDVHRTIEALWRMESARLIAAMARRVRDVGLAEELAQDALVSALEQWPAAGIPDNPAAWLMTTAKNRAIDQLRRRRMLEGKHALLGHELEREQQLSAGSIEASAEDVIGDDLLRLIFIACHPVLSTEARTALTLQLIGGLSTAEIARAFLVPEATIAQRIVRAKRVLARARSAVRAAARASSWVRAWPRSWRSSTSYSTRGTPRPRARTGCGRHCARRRCASAGSWRNLRPARARCTDWSR